MARLCERPGCSAPADVAYGFDAQALSVWLDEYEAAQGARSGVLCRRHADAMVVPLGWMLDDRREPVPRLFRPPVEAIEAPPAAVRRRSRQRPGDDTLQLRLDAIADELARIEAAEPDLDDAPSPLPTAPRPIARPRPAPPPAVVPARHRDPVPVEAHEPDPEPVPEPEPVAAQEPENDAEAAAPWRPVFDQNDDLSGLLKARGRLLSRAFNGAPTDGH